jgi:hypothetical protein
MRPCGTLPSNNSFYIESHGRRDDCNSRSALSRRPSRSPRLRLRPRLLKTNCGVSAGGLRLPLGGVKRGILGSGQARRSHHASFTCPQTTHFLPLDFSPNLYTDTTHTDLLPPRTNGCYRFRRERRPPGAGRRAVRVDGRLPSR